MEKRYLGIDGVPALLWGEPRERLLLLVHGLMSNKEDAAIERAALCAVERGFAALSFDLPEHGERRGLPGRPCTPQNGRREVAAAYRFAAGLAARVDVFACSLGAYLTLLALPDIDPGRLFLLSPLVDMRGLIERSMAAAGVSPERLARERHIPLPGAQPLDWDYYVYARDAPVLHEKRPPMAVLRGGLDNVSTGAELDAFVRWYGAELTLLPEAEHWFHTEAQLSALADWLSPRL